MFSERKIICYFLLLFLFLPLFNINKNKDLFLLWFVCSYCLFIFPFLSAKIINSIFLM